MNSKLHFLPLLLLFSLLTIPCQSQLPPQPSPATNSFISLLISAAGLDFVRDVLVTTAVSSLTPLHLPHIEKSQRIPLAGNVRVLISNITLYRINASDSFVTPGDSGVSIVVSGATANLTMDWRYSYTTGWLLSRNPSGGRARRRTGGEQRGVVEGGLEPPEEQTRGET